MAHGSDSTTEQRGAPFSGITSSNSPDVEKTEVPHVTEPEIFYEDGVFRPLAPVQLADHQAIALVLETNENVASAADHERPIWAVAAALVRDIPEDVLSTLPT